MRLTRPILRMISTPFICPSHIPHPTISDQASRMCINCRVNCLTPCAAATRTLHVSSAMNSSKGSDVAGSKTKTPTPAVYVSLDTEGGMVACTLVEAEKLAQRRGLRLMRHPDTELENKFRRPAYKLVTNKEYFEASSKSKKKASGSYIKGETILELSHRISDNDLQVKIKSIMIKNLKKSKQVRLNLAGTETTHKRLEELLKQIQDGVSGVGGKVQQVQKKGHDIKCLVNPPRPNKTKTGDDATSDSEI